MDCSAETYFGFIQTIDDALLLVEAVRRGLVSSVNGRLNDAQQRQIRSGSIFVWNEDKANIKRWTDGKFWSNSRMKGRFFLYKELPNSKKILQVERQNRTAGHADQNSHHENLHAQVADKPPKNMSDASMQSCSFSENQDCMSARRDFLRKKSISVRTIGNEKFHLVSYYYDNDIKAKTLHRPSQNEKISRLHVKPGFYFTGLDDTPLMITNSAFSVSSDSPPYFSSSMSGLDEFPEYLNRDYSQKGRSPEFDNDCCADNSSESMFSCASPQGCENKKSLLIASDAQSRQRCLSNPHGYTNFVQREELPVFSVERNIHNSNQIRHFSAPSSMFHPTNHMQFSPRPHEEHQRWVSTSYQNCPPHVSGYDLRMRHDSQREEHYQYLNVCQKTNRAAPQAQPELSPGSRSHAQGMCGPSSRFIRQHHHQPPLHTVDDSNRITGAHSSVPTGYSRTYSSPRATTLPSIPKVIAAKNVNYYSRYQNYADAPTESKVEPGRFVHENTFLPPPSSSAFDQQQIDLLDRKLSF